MSNLISIIVPVYNVERYLNECIDSILKQSYKNIEILLIDDGSSDNSGTICDEYLKKDKRIKVFHKQNGGLSDARNYGIKYSTGDYLIFIDSDDVIDSKLVKVLNSSINDADIGIIDLAHFYDGTDPRYISTDKSAVYTKEAAICEMLYQKKFLVSATGKIFKKELFSNIKFPKGMLFEDIAIMYKLFNYSNKIVYNESKLYGYRHRNSSITTSNFSKRDLDILKICDEMNDYFKNSNRKIKTAVNCYTTNANLRIFLNSYGLDEYKDINKKCKNSIYRNWYKIIFNKNVRLKMKFAILLFILNKKIMIKIYKKIDRWK